jgi:hypothetical protein
MLPRGTRPLPAERPLEHVATAIMTTFHEVRLPDNVAYGATAGP